MAGLSLTTATAQPSDREILGYSRYVVLVAAFFAMFVISPFEYAWSTMSGHIGATVVTTFFTPESRNRDLEDLRDAVDVK